MHVSCNCPMSLTAVGLSVIFILVILIGLQQYLTAFLICFSYCLIMLNTFLYACFLIYKSSLAISHFMYSVYFPIGLFGFHCCFVRVLDSCQILDTSRICVLQIFPTSLLLFHSPNKVLCRAIVLLLLRCNISVFYIVGLSFSAKSKNFCLVLDF